MQHVSIVGIARVGVAPADGVWGHATNRTVRKTRSVYLFILNRCVRRLVMEVQRSDVRQVRTVSLVFVAEADVQRFAWTVSAPMIGRACNFRRSTYANDVAHRPLIAEKAPFARATVDNDYVALEERV